MVWTAWGGVLVLSNMQMRLSRSWFSAWTLRWLRCLAILARKIPWPSEFSQQASFLSLSFLWTQLLIENELHAASYPASHSLRHLGQIIKARMERRKKPKCFYWCNLHKFTLSSQSVKIFHWPNASPCSLGKSSRNLGLFGLWPRLFNRRLKSFCGHGHH